MWSPVRPWFKTAYRRAVIDMHIPDWDEAFLSRFDSDRYVEMLKTAKAQSIVAYAQSHVGLFNYPTKVGKQHGGLKGRDILGEIIDKCRKAGINAQVYTSLIFDRWAWDNHPDWRMIAFNGDVMGKGGRHGLNCPNSPYREYVRSWVKELCQGYDFAGIRFDMTFWPNVCYCAYCRKRFADEVGGEIPKTINWLDEKWVAFQKRREAWLAEFAEVATSTVREHRPTASVEHQSSTFPLSWTFGVSDRMLKQMDFLQGDFYGDSWQGSFVRKLLEDLTPNRPFGFETSFSLDLQDHTAMKSEPLLEAKASAAIADSAAFIFIDAIDPVGTLNPKVYERMGGIFDRLMPYYEHLGGERIQDVAIFYSLDSKFSFATNGKSVGHGEMGADAHTASAMAAARRLIAHHMPLGIIGRRSLLSKLSRHRVLILPNVCVLDAEEAAAIREWTRGGGKLLATGWTSLVDKQGQPGKDFQLADIFGVSLKKPSWEPWPHYIAPTDAGRDLFGYFDAERPAFAKTIGLEIEPKPSAEVWATTTLPWPTDDPTRFSSIHSNPPWVKTQRPEITRHRFGSGEAIYCASAIETIEALFDVLPGLVQRLHPQRSFEVDAPACVEATLFHQADRHRFVFALTNFQKDLPNIPVDGIAVRLRLPQTAGAVRSVRLLPDGRPIEHQNRDGVASFVAPRLETLRMFAMEVGAG